MCVCVLCDYGVPLDECFVVRHQVAEDQRSALQYKTPIICQHLSASVSICQHLNLSASESVSICQHLSQSVSSDTSAATRLCGGECGVCVLVYAEVGEHHRRGAAASKGSEPEHLKDHTSDRSDNLRPKLCEEQRKVSDVITHPVRRIIDATVDLQTQPKSVRQIPHESRPGSVYQTSWFIISIRLVVDLPGSFCKKCRRSCTRK